MPQFATYEALPKGFTKDDLDLVRHLRHPDVGVLRDIQPSRLQSGRVLFCVCSDGDRFCNVHDHFRLRFRENGHDPVTHTIALAGGPIRIPRRSPVLRTIRGDHTLIRNEIEAGAVLKDIRHGIVCPHWPCGAAVISGVGFLGTLHLLVKTKRTLDEDFPGIEFGYFFDFDFGAAEQRSYHVPISVLSSWLQANANTKRLRRPLPLLAPQSLAA